MLYRDGMGTPTGRLMLLILLALPATTSSGDPLQSQALQAAIDGALDRSLLSDERVAVDGCLIVMERIIRNTVCIRGRFSSYSSTVSLSEVERAFGFDAPNGSMVVLLPDPDLEALLSRLDRPGTEPFEETAATVARAGFLSFGKWTECTGEQSFGNPEHSFLVKQGEGETLGRLIERYRRDWCPSVRRS